MERHRIGDQEAFELLRDHSRRTGRKLVDVATSILDGHVLLPATPNSPGGSTDRDRPGNDPR